jgi:hypothetical protein
VQQTQHHPEPHQAADGGADIERPANTPNDRQCRPVSGPRESRVGLAGCLDDPETESGALAGFVVKSRAMFHPIAIYIGLRYTRAKRRNHFISFISGTSMVGITLGIVALIVVLSVMNGFHKEIQARILSMASHATLADPYGGGMKDWRDVLERCAPIRMSSARRPSSRSRGCWSTARR